MRQSKRVLRRAFCEVPSHKDAANEMALKPSHLSKSLDEDSLEQLGFGDVRNAPLQARIVAARWLADSVDCDLVPRAKSATSAGNLRTIQRLLKETSEVIDALIASGVSDPEGPAVPSPSQGSQLVKEAEEAIEVLHHVRRLGLSGVECARTMRRAS